MKVVVVDDHPLVYEGIRAVLEAEKDFEMVGWACGGQDVERLFTRFQPDLALIDLRLPGEYGLDIVKKGREFTPKCRFVILTTFAQADDIRQAISAGVDGYILKEALPEEMVSALRLVSRGRPYFDPSVMQILISQSNRGSALAELTERELEVLKALARGLNNKEISDLICVTEHTVKKHVSSILGKLELKDRTQAALFAVEHGLQAS